MLAYIIHNKDVRSEAVACLRPEHFIGEEYRGHAAIWHVFLSHWRSTGQVPSKSVIFCEAQALLQADPGVASAVIVDTANLVDWLFGPDNTPETLATSGHGLALLKLFMTDYIRRTGIRRLDDSVAIEANIQLPQIVRDISTQLSAVSAIGVRNDAGVIPEIWPQENREPFRTGTFIDDYMITYPGDVNVILGPTGGGKTTLALQLIVSTAWRLYNADPANCGWCGYFGYEDEQLAPIRRMIANAARIPMSRLLAMKSYDDLSTSSNPLPYEIKMGPDNRGEQERLRRAKQWLDKCVRVFDFSGRPDSNGVAYGYGGLDEVVATIDRTSTVLGRPIKLLVIDWAGMLVRRYLQRQGRSLEKGLTVELECFVDQVYQITSRMNCVAYVVHQLRGQANRLSPVAAVSHADAAWCSNFAVNAWNVIVLGNKDHESGAFTISLTKCRRNKTKQNLLCYIDGDYCNIRVDKKFYMDYMSRQIIEEPENRYDGEDTAVRGVPARGGEASDL